MVFKFGLAVINIYRGYRVVFKFCCLLEFFGGLKKNINVWFLFLDILSELFWRSFGFWDFLKLFRRFKYVVFDFRVGN